MKRIIQKVQAMSKMNLLAKVSKAVEDKKGDHENQLNLRNIKAVLMKPDQFEIMGPKTTKNKSTS